MIMSHFSTFSDRLYFFLLIYLQLVFELFLCSFTFWIYFFDLCVLFRIFHF
jgi:hypothetical protein